MINGQTCSLTQWMHLIRFKQKQEDMWFPFLSLPTPWYPCPLPVILCSLTIFTTYSLCYPSLPLLSPSIPPLIHIHSFCYLYSLCLSSLSAPLSLPTPSVILHTLSDSLKECLCLFLLIQCIHNGVRLSGLISLYWQQGALLCSSSLYLKKKNHLNTRNWTGGTWGLSVLYL